MIPLRHLDIPGWHLCYYIPSNGTPDEFSTYLLKFKDNTQPYVDLWCKWASKALSGAIKVDHIVRALARRDGF
ncbi:MAG: hypothetical protein K2X86_10005 [Cytophagaceae bacterium]|nr:hypothetical protein [Cytophagaceae bacterium]